MELVDFNSSVKAMQDSFNFRIRKFPVYSFGEKHFCEKIFKAAILKTDETITEFQWLPEYDEIINYLQNTQGKGLLLAGDVGRGKTTIILHVLPLLFYHFHKKVIKCTHANELKIHLEECKSRKLISVDELGTEPTANDFGNKYEPANNLFDMAESLSKIVFVSTNLSSDSIINRYGIRTLDRITRLCRIVKFKGESLRK